MSPQTPRRTWLIWLEGKGPDFVLEITSKSTKREDEVRKKKLYEELGVKEYWQFDPTGDYLDPILKGRELGPNGRYRDLLLEERDGVLRHRSLLGLELCLERERLYYFDPANNVRLLTPAEQRDSRHKEKPLELREAIEGRLQAPGRKCPGGAVRRSDCGGLQQDTRDLGLQNLLHVEADLHHYLVGVFPEFRRRAAA